MLLRRRSHPAGFRRRSAEKPVRNAIRAVMLTAGLPTHIGGSWLIRALTVGDRG
jgi:hypothetical protein